MKSIDGIKDNMSMLAFGRKRSLCLKSKTCVKCGEKVKFFNDSKSKREYKISAICQPCQDDIFEVK